MGMDTRSAYGGSGRAGVRAAVLSLSAVAGVALLPTGAAHASVIGIGIGIGIGNRSAMTHRVGTAPAHDL